MQNHEVAKILYDIADLLEMRQENVFKVRAYRRAAQAIESLSQSVEDYAKQDKLHEIPGVGLSISEKIMEFIETGKIKYYETLKKRMPMDIEGLMSIEGMGPKKIMVLYKKLKIKTVKDMEAAAKAGKIRNLARFGQKTEENILRNLQFSRKNGSRMLLGIALPIAEELVAELSALPFVRQVNYAGSLRRMKETIGDIDILATSASPEKVIRYFTNMNSVVHVIAQGPTKASVRLRNGLQVDLRVLPENQYGSSLMYFTGSKEHNIELRRIAIAKGLKLSEYGLFKGEKMIAGAAENDVYSVLGLDYVAPEMREAAGEVESARKHTLPKLIEYNDIIGDLHVHTRWSDGLNTIQEMAQAAKKMGYEYICITDHVGELKIARAINEKQLLQQTKEIEKLNDKIGIKILAGAEIDIRQDGKFDISNDILKELDIVVASLHSAIKRPKDFNTKRLLAAMENPKVDIIGHPTARLINKREAADLDMQKIFKKANETGTFLEINALPDRLDLNDANARANLEAGNKVVISTDAHSISNLNYMRLGVAVARRAWHQKKDVINAMPYNKFCKIFDISK